MTGLSCKFVTDTSTLCVFDLECLKHRINDDADWWSIPEDELLEVNNGNVIFIGVGEDGEYNISFRDQILNPKVVASLNVVSGRVFIGAGEEVTADGLEPECLDGGIFLDLPKGVYQFSFSLDGNNININYSKHGSGKNNFTDLLRLI